jgi:ankyrin repeat and SOCS box protein 2
MLLRAGADVNLKNTKRITALYQACRHGHLEVARTLLEDAHAEVNPANYSGSTPIHEASARGYVCVEVGGSLR